jgi:hypothetical protein
MVLAFTVRMPSHSGLRRTRAAELLVARPVRHPAVLWQIRHKQRQRTKEQERHGLRSFSSSRATIAAPRDPLDRALRQYSRPPRHDRRALPHHGVRRPAVFFRVQNIMIILQDASIYMVLAMGMTPTSARPSFGSSRTASRPCLTSPTPRCWSGTTPSSRRNGGSTQPLSVVAFSHLNGALNMCRYVLETLGSEGTLALIRGKPGSIDDQRSGGFADCVTTEGNWEVAYEHYGNFTREGGYTGAQQILQASSVSGAVFRGSRTMAHATLSAEPSPPSAWAVPATPTAASPRSPPATGLSCG